MLGKGACLPGSNEKYLQPPVKLPSGDDSHAGRHTGRHAGAVIRLGCVLCGQLYSAARGLLNHPLGKLFKLPWGEKENSLG
ncbi:hypothetical protein PBY51_024498 [Eleginops maclovinus]|uniref:Uncharacterized protein n=1 Tax=Eleginops maclovinus TaxID=56733 RepID=A0AAN7XTW4_ELEMC|nr:hypothetical protein PBY51_024498 [Eleginops maclovinus]